MVQVSPNDKGPCLPVVSKERHHIFVRWGRNIFDDSPLMPFENVAWIDEIEKGGWSFCDDHRYVKISVMSFMEPGRDRNGHWLDLEEGQYLLGLLATWEREQCVYVVVNEVVRGKVFRRWPKVVGKEGYLKRPPQW